jgi:hypothetical protein
MFPVIPPAEKRVALVTLPNHYENRLFFSARNLAIEALMLRIEVLMLRAGHDVKVEWQESSMYAPSIRIMFMNPKPTASSWEYATAQVYINRERINVPREKASDCFYSLKMVHTSEHWPYKESKAVAAFRAFAQKLADEGYFETEVNKVNYPFDYSSHSSF